MHAKIHKQKTRKKTENLKKGEREKIEIVHVYALNGKYLCS